jgi:hypothetical protein
VLACGQIKLQSHHLELLIVLLSLARDPEFGASFSYEQRYCIQLENLKSMRPIHSLAKSTSLAVSSLGWTGRHTHRCGTFQRPRLRYASRLLFLHLMSSTKTIVASRVSSSASLTSTPLCSLSLFHVSQQPAADHPTQPA